VIKWNLSSRMILIYSSVLVSADYSLFIGTGVPNLFSCRFMMNYGITTGESRMHSGEIFARERTRVGDSLKPGYSILG
jgi:hypothetical protein